MKASKKGACLVLPPLLFLAAAKDGVGAEWDFSESVSTSIAFTDNVELVETDTESDWALIVSPNFLINGTGRRLSVSVAASLQFVSGSEETFYPRIRASAHSELVKNHFFLDAFATAYQRTIDPLRPAGNPINRTGNLTTTYSVGFSPYYVTHFGDFADLRVGYSYRHQFYVSDDLDDRDYNDFDFRLNSGRRFSVFDWSLSGNYSHTSYESDSASNTTFRSLDFNLGYRLTRSLYINGSVGHEWNDYQSTRRDRTGPTWSAGARWSPHPRFSLNAGYRYRFGEHHPYADLFYRRRRSVVRLRYSVDLVSGYEPIDRQEILVETDPLGNPVDPFTGDPLEPGVQELGSPIDNGANIAETFRVSYFWSGRRTSLGVNGRHTDRVYENSPREILEWRLGMNMNRQLGRQLSVNGNATWYRSEDETDFRADTWDLGFRITRGLGNHSNLTFSYTYSQRDSNRPSDDYTENRVALVLTTSMVGLAKHADLL